MVQEAIRNVRVTTSSTADQLSSGIRRCNVLETSAYIDIRLKLLRCISDNQEEEDSTRQEPEKNDDDDDSQLCGVGDRGTQEWARSNKIGKTLLHCHLGNGISVRACFFSSPGCREPPLVNIVWRHLDNDTSLPVADPKTKNQPACSTLDDDDGWGEEKKGGNHSTKNPAGTSSSSSTGSSSTGRKKTRNTKSKKQRGQGEGVWMEGSPGSSSSLTMQDPLLSAGRRGEGQGD